MLNWSIGVCTAVSCEMDAAVGTATSAAAAATPSPPPPPPLPGRAGYLGFGSFHGDNVEVMVNDPGWQEPPNPCEMPVAELEALAATPFGAPFRRHYLIDFER